MADLVRRAQNAVCYAAPGLRTALIIVDNDGYIFTPTALYLEAEPTDGAVSNAVRMSGEQVAQALARLSLAASRTNVANGNSVANNAHQCSYGNSAKTNEQCGVAAKHQHHGFAIGPPHRAFQCRP